jgi:hypothetical protein
MLDTLLALVQAHPMLLILAGAVLLAFSQSGSLNLAKLWEIIKGALSPKAKDPDSPAVAKDESPAAIVGHFTAIKHHCKDCQEAQAALKSLWVHLEPGIHTGGSK